MMMMHISDSSFSTIVLEITAASTPLELQSQLFDTLNVAPSEIRLSHRSRTLQLSQSSSSLEELNLSPYSTIDLSFRLRGGGPKKRCAHVFVKATSGSGSSTPSGSGVATPASTAAAPSVASSAAAAVAPVAAIKEKKQGEVKEGENKAEGAEIQASGPVSAIPAVAEPVLERCSNAALVSFLTRPLLLVVPPKLDFTSISTNIYLCLLASVFVSAENGRRMP